MWVFYKLAIWLQFLLGNESYDLILKSITAQKWDFHPFKFSQSERLEAAMSKLSFRARALDANKTLPVYHEEDVPDLPDITSVNRVVPQMPTGMEKEEETEHHLQRAISAQQIYGEAQRLIIPTPDTILFENNYEQLKQLNVQMPKQFIHVQAFTLEDELPDYDCDDIDQQWIASYNKKQSKKINTIGFERMIETLERGCGTRIDLFTVNDAKALLKKDEELVVQLYDFWKSKKLREKCDSLTPTVRTEKKDNSALHDPYVAFRRRIEKMQTRKNRKNDEASYEKMLKLRRDLNRACLIMEMVKLREEKKRDLLATTVKVLESRYSNKDFHGELLFQCYDILKQRQLQNRQASSVKSNSLDERVNRDISVDDARKRHKLFKQRPTSIVLKEESQSSQSEPATCTVQVRSEVDNTLNDGPDGKYTFKRSKGVMYHAPRYDSMGNWPWTHPVEGGSADPRYCYCYTSQKKRCIGFARRRKGRGGRLLFDRAYSPFDEYLNQPNKFNSDAVTSFQDRVPPWPHFKPQVEVNSSDENENETNHEPVNSKCLNVWARKQVCRKPSQTKLDRTSVKFRLHPYTLKSTSSSPSLNNQMFLASIAANFAKSTDSQHVIPRRTKQINHLANLLSPTKVQLSSSQMVSPSRPPSTAPASSVYQLNFPLSTTSPAKASVNTCSNIVRKTIETAIGKPTTIEHQPRTTQLVVVTSQPIVSRQPLSIVQQAYLPRKVVPQQQGAQINSFQVQPVVNSIRANKLSISKASAINHSSVVTNGVTTIVPAVQISRSRKSLPGFNTLRRASSELQPTISSVTVGK